MDFEGFMGSCKEQWGDTDGDTISDAPHPADRRLADLPDWVPGFATENKLMLLNLAVQHMEPGEVYVEVGTWQGLSLIGASRGNDRKHLVACDDFSKLGACRRSLDRHLAVHCPDNQVDVYASDFREFLDAAPWQPARVGAYFYDGSHRFRDQFDALRLIRPWLAPDAAIIIDDTDDQPVRAANQLFERHVPALEPVLDIRAPHYKDAAWWNGVQVYRWRSDAPPPDLPISRLVYLPRLLLWNRLVVYGQRTLDLATAALRGRR